MSRVNGKWTILCGAGVGWLIGLSASPIVSTVVSSVIGTLFVLASAFSGMRGEPGPVTKRSPADLDFKAAGLLLLGIILGSSMGLITRTHSWLSPSAKSVIAEWSQYGLNRNEIAQRLFDEKYPQLPDLNNLRVSEHEGDMKTSPAEKPNVDIYSTALFALPVDTCKRFQADINAEKFDDLKADMEEKGGKSKAFAEAVKNEVDLKLAVEVFLCPEH